MDSINGYSELALSALKYFESLHGSVEHTFLSISPASMMLLGDHTHYNEGILLSLRINLYWVCVFRKRKDKIVTFANTKTGKYISTCYDNPEFESGPDFRLLRGLTKKLCENEIINFGFDCVMESNVPECLGLGSSSSMQISFINNISKAYSVDIEQSNLLNLIHKNELNKIGKISNTGHCVNVQYGKEGKILSYDLRTKEREMINFNSKKYEIVICDTKQELHNPQDRCNERVEECEIGVKSLRLYIWGIKNLRDIESDFLLRHYHMIPKKIFTRVLYNVNERKRAQEAISYFKDGDIDKVGELIKASHWALSQDYEISHPTTDFLVEEASKIKGALGSKMISCSPIISTFNIVEEEHADYFVNRISESYKEKYGQELNIYRVKIVDGVKKTSAKKVFAALN